MKKKSKLNSSIVPHAREVANHFSPSKIEEHGLGPAFFAIVAAFIVLILLSVFGNNYLTGAYHTWYSPERPVSLGFVNLTFTTTSYATLPVEPYSGPFAAVRATITGPTGLSFSLNEFSSREVFVVTNNLSRTAPPVGTVIFYDYSARRWRVYCGAGHRYGCPVTLGYIYFYPNLRGLNEFDSPYVPLNVSSAFGRSRYASFNFNFAPSRTTTPPAFDVRFDEVNLRNIPIYPNNTWSNGTWTITWNNTRPARLYVVQYDIPNSGFPPFPTVVMQGFVSGPGSKLLVANSTMVKIQFAYDRNYCYGLTCIR